MDEDILGSGGKKRDTTKSNNYKGVGEKKTVMRLIHFRVEINGPRKTENVMGVTREKFKDRVFYTLVLFYQ